MPAAAEETPGSEPTALERPLPDFRRAVKADALLFARQTFLDGGRVDMQALAGQLGVARATLYSWFGSREQLLEELLSEIAVDIFDTLDLTAVGEGAERMLNIARPLMEAYSNLEPLRAFAAREPTLALKIIVAEEGLVHRRTAERLLRTVAAGSAEPQPALVELIAVVTQISSNLVWVTYAIGGEPQIDRAMRVIRILLASAQAEGLLPR